MNKREYDMMMKRLISVVLVVDDDSRSAGKCSRALDGRKAMRQVSHDRKSASVRVVEGRGEGGGRNYGT